MGRSVAVAGIRLVCVLIHMGSGALMATKRHDGLQAVGVGVYTIGPRVGAAGLGHCEGVEQCSLSLPFCSKMKC